MQSGGQSRTSFQRILRTQYLIPITETSAAETPAFLTCEPNPLVAPFHEKAMPVIVHPEDDERWLDAEVDDT